MVLKDGFPSRPTCSNNHKSYIFIFILLLALGNLLLSFKFIIFYSNLTYIVACEEPLLFLLIRRGIIY